MRPYSKYRDIFWRYMEGDKEYHPSCVLYWDRWELTDDAYFQASANKYAYNVDTHSLPEAIKKFLTDTNFGRPEKDWRGQEGHYYHPVLMTTVEGEDPYTEDERRENGGEFILNNVNISRYLTEKSFEQMLIHDKEFWYIGGNNQPQLILPK